jgi:hypothetical protein
LVVVTLASFSDEAMLMLDAEAFEVTFYLLSVRLVVGTLVSFSDEVMPLLHGKV